MFVFEKKFGSIFYMSQEGFVYLFICLLLLFLASYPAGIKITYEPIAFCPFFHGCTASFILLRIPELMFRSARAGGRNTPLPKKQKNHAFSCSLVRRKNGFLNYHFQCDTFIAFLYELQDQVRDQILHNTPQLQIDTPTLFRILRYI